MVFSTLTSSRNWGLAAVYAYRAYNDRSLLSIATTVWENVNMYFITTDEAINGAHPTKNVTFHATCGGKSSAIPRK